MVAEPPMARIGALIGSPMRAQILTALFDGRAHTAAELAHAVGAPASTVSEHLSLMLHGALLKREKSGRNNYYALASPDIAYALEQLVAHIAHAGPESASASAPRKKIKPIQQARLCYDHIAGRLGVQLADALTEKGAVRLKGRDYEVTAKGAEIFECLGVSVSDARAQRRVFARQCLDWSERRRHIAGALGAALAEAAFQQGWISRAKEKRVLTLSRKGREALQSRLGVSFAPLEEF